MAGVSVGESPENPVAINVTAMVDVIFCLCLFFMCSMHFKQLEGKVETWLPKDRGPNPTPVIPVVEEIRVFMRWDEASGTTVRRVGSRQTRDDGELTTEILAMARHHEQTGQPDFPVLIDATADVPWQDVIHVLDLCKGRNMRRIEFAQPAEYAAQRR